MSAFTILRALEPGAFVAQFDSPTLDAAMLQAYAEASGDLNPLHLDPDFARQAGFDDVIAHGMLGMAYVGRMLAETFGQQRIIQFQARFVAIVPLGSILRCRAWLSERSTDYAWLKLDAVVPGSGGAPDRVVISGLAQVDLRDGVEP